jgi:hypothetical protein
VERARRHLHSGSKTLRGKDSGERRDTSLYGSWPPFAAEAASSSVVVPVAGGAGRRRAA